MEGEQELETFIPDAQGVHIANGHLATDEPPPPITKRAITKNLLVVSVAFLFLFTSFQSLQNLQSSLNKEEGIGTVSLAVLYTCGVLGGLFLPPLVIKKLGCKWTLVLSMCSYIIFMAANLYPIWGTMIPACIIIGLGAATLWAAKCTYLTQTATWYAELTDTSRASVNSTFFGVFFSLFQTSQVWGNLISSTVFRQNIPENNTSVDADVLSKCGAKYCPSDYQNNTNLDRPELTKIYTLCGIYIGSAVLAVIIILVLLDNIKVRTDVQSQTTKQLLSAIARHFFHSDYQKLLIPITVYSGVEQAFIASDFTRSFVSCSTGVWNVGYVMMAYGAANCIFSLLIGRMVKFTGFTPWFLLMLGLHMGSLLTMLLWAPSPDHIAVFYVLAVLWGVGDAIIQTLVNAYYGTLFTTRPETAFASYRLCESAGFILAFGYSSFVCTDVKIYVSLALLVVGVSLYGVTEYLRLKRNDEERD